MHNKMEQVETLYARYAPAIVRYLTHLTGDDQSAQDLAQDTFVKVLRHWEQLASDERARAWLFRIATNTANDAFRQLRRRATTQLTDTLAATLVATPAGLSVEERELLWAAFDQLPAYYRTPLLLRGYAGYTVDDIARLLGCKVGTIKSRLNRGRVLFQKRYAAL